jgi:serine/threonine-protein kinase
MSEPSPETVEALFHEVADLDPQRRGAYLNQRCAGDPELRAAVEELLRFDAKAQSATDFLQSPAADLRPALPVPRVHLREPGQDHTTPLNKPHSEQMPQPQDLPGKYQLVGEIARGGMGAVFKGRDVDLGRDIAVKVMLEGHKGRTELLQRFVEEAQIGGQLQHPGVVPVYELGQAADKRPYFAMKLVKGQTLAQLLKERGAEGANGECPSEDLPRFLGIFEQVCHTIAYAHAHGVIHRDLKPANIMVGSFGEVQVMDWGLAKVLPRGGRADEDQDRGRERAEGPTVIRTARSGQDRDGEGAEDAADRSGSGTRAGSVLGTLAYMAPEQARGDVDLVDERADVFGLGAILCEVLTGQPPFTGTNVEMLRKAQKGLLDEALQRLNGCGAAAELIGLARKCLAPEPWDRPRQAGAVAEAVTDYQQSVQQRLRQAELDRVAALAKAEEEGKRRQVEQARATEERRRRRLSVALAACLLLLVLGGSAAGLWYQHDQAQRAADEAIRHEQARQKHERTEQDIRNALERATQLQKELHAQLRRPGGVFRLLDKPGDWQHQIEVARQELQRAQDLTGGAEEPVAQELQLRIRALQAQLRQDEADRQLALDLDQVRQERSTHLMGKLNYTLAQRKYPEVFRRAGLEVEAGAVPELARRLGQSPVREQLAAALDDWALVSTNQKQLAERLLEIARSADPDPWRAKVRDPHLLANKSGLRKFAEELRRDGKALAQLSPQTLHLVGNVLTASPADAAAWLRAAQALHPGDFWLNFELAGALHNAKLPEAAGYCRAALAVRPTSAAAWYNLGVFLWDQKQPAEAEAAFRKALQFDAQFAKAWHGLGIALWDQKRAAEAEAAFRKALQFDPQNASVWNNFGNALVALGGFAEAEAAFRKALQFDPQNANPWNNLGNALRDQGRFAEAEASYLQVLKLLSPQDPRCAALQNRLQHCRQLLELEGRLAPVLRGELATTAERLALIDLCVRYKKHYAAAARLYAAAFAQQPGLAEETSKSRRYHAACCAVLAAAGQGKGAENLAEHERAQLRGQALAWLTADLQALRKIIAAAESGKAGQPPLSPLEKLAGPGNSRAVEVLQALERLKHWQRDTDLAGVRDEKQLALLPAAEQKSWRALWAEVAALAKKARAISPEQHGKGP